MTKLGNINTTNFRRVLSIGLAAVALVLAVLFFAASVLLMQPWFATQVAQAGLGLESSALLFLIIALALSIGSFIISWKQRSLLVAGLLSASGVIFMLHPLSTFFMMHTQMAASQMGSTGQMAVNGVPPALFGVIIGLTLIGLGVAKGIRTGRSAAKQPAIR